MKQITARKKKCVLLSAVLAAVVVLTLWSCTTQHGARRRVIGSFEDNRPAFEAAARQVLEQGGTQGVAGPPGVSEISYWTQEIPTVEFQFGGWGLGGGTRYWGVNYVEEDEPIGFQGGRWDYWKAEGAGRMYYEPESDNRCYVQRLDQGWYYFEAFF